MQLKFKIQEIDLKKNTKNEKCIATIDLFKKEEQDILNSKKGRMLYAVYQKKRVGFISFVQKEKGVYLRILFVVPKYHGNGVGKFLLSTLDDIVKQEYSFHYFTFIIGFDCVPVLFFDKYGFTFSSITIQHHDYMNGMYRYFIKKKITDSFKQTNNIDEIRKFLNIKSIETNLYGNDIVSDDDIEMAEIESDIESEIESDIDMESEDETFAPKPSQKKMFLFDSQELPIQNPIQETPKPIQKEPMKTTSIQKEPMKTTSIQKEPMKTTSIQKEPIKNDYKGVFKNNFKFDFKTSNNCSILECHNKSGGVKCNECKLQKKERTLFIKKQQKHMWTSIEDNLIILSIKNKDSTIFNFFDEKLKYLLNERICFLNFK
jgi:GNAT superfamily N-acetyltransferase